MYITVLYIECLKLDQYQYIVIQVIVTLGLCAQNA